MSADKCMGEQFIPTYGARLASVPVLCRRLFFAQILPRHVEGMLYGRPLSEYCHDRSPSPPLSPSTSHEDSSMVYVIDDDASIREMLGSLFRSIGLRVEVFGSASELLQGKLPDVASCLVLDIRLPGLSGLDLQAELSAANIHTPIIFMTGHGDIPMSVRAMKAGAVDFLTKPFRDQDLLDAVTAALERDRKRRQHEREVSDLRIRFEALTRANSK